MSAPRKAIFARTQSQARAYGRAFELDPLVWASFGLNAQITAKRDFDNIVVILPPNVTAREFAQVHAISQHVAEKGTIGLISPHDDPKPIPELDYTGKFDE